MLNNSFVMVSAGREDRKQRWLQRFWFCIDSTDKDREVLKSVHSFNIWNLHLLCIG